MIKQIIYLLLLFIITMEAIQAGLIDHPKGVQQKQFKYLLPSSKIDPGFFKKYQFDLRFPEIKNSSISKNIFQGALDFLTFKFTHETEGKKKPTTKEDFQFIQKQLPMLKPNFKEYTQDKIRCTWIGHSTVVIQVGPDNFIIDPVFSEKKAKKRYRPPACQIDQLPKIDVVLISHDHYDHCDTNSLTELQDTSKPLFIAGIGSEDIMPKQSRNKLMDWTQRVEIQLKAGKYYITFVPACHWARRGLNDLNTRLWGGFVIQTPFKQKLFYSGDTGFCQVYGEIGEAFGPFDLSILPIGAYEPRQLLKPQHINPEEAVKIHKLIKSRQSLGVHWGTFSMGRQGFAQPKYDLLKACKQNGLKQEQFIVIKHGESRIFQ